MTIQQVEKKIQWIDNLTLEMLSEEFIQRVFFDEWDLLAQDLPERFKSWKMGQKIRVLKENGMATVENYNRYVLGK